MHRTTLRTLLLSLAVTGLTAGSAGVSMAQNMPSGSTILLESSRAYDALAAYSCHVAVTSTVSNAGSTTATADVQFTRPDQISISGTSLFNTPYSLTSDGVKATLTANGTSRPVQSFEYGLGAISGISGGAGTVIPALLMRTKWGYPFSPSLVLSNTVIIQPVNGHSCYMVVELSPLRRAFWIDTQTYLLDQTAIRLTLPSMTVRSLQTITNSNPTPSASVAAPSGSG